MKFRSDVEFNVKDSVTKWNIRHLSIKNENYNWWDILMNGNFQTCCGGLEDQKNWN